MRNRLKKLIAALLTAALTAAFFAPTAVLAADYRHFTQYDVSIELNENNTLNVVESFTCDYGDSTPGHGVLFELPKKLTGTLPDGKTRTYNCLISNVSVNDQYSIEDNNDYLQIYIGDPDSLATGVKDYVVSYTYDIGDLYYDPMDFFYYLIISSGWNADIDNVTFSVNMPKPFDENEVYAFVGDYFYSEPLTVSVSGLNISGSVPHLSPYTGISLKVNLPAGYFVGARSIYSAANVILGIDALLVLIGVLLWYFFGRDKKLIPIVSFYAPKELDSAGAGYVLDGVAAPKELSSLIIYWADKGYLSIDETKKDEITLNKLTEGPPGEAPAYARIMWDGLFEGRDSVRVDELRESFYTTMQSAQKAVEAHFETGENRVYTGASLKIQSAFKLLASVPLFLLFALNIYFNEGNIFFAIIFSLLLAALVSIPISSLIKLGITWNTTKPSKRRLKLVFSLLLMAAAILIVLFSVDLPIVYSIAAAAATLILAPVAIFTRKRTERSYKWMCELEGLRNFIIAAEKDRIELLCEENPNYFYGILPFAYVMGITDVWAKNFERIGITPPPPAWYSGYNMNMFTTIWFMNSMNRSLTHFQSAAISHPGRNASGGDGFGGGFGGGMGGGGSFGGFGGSGGGGW